MTTKMTGNKSLTAKRRRTNEMISTMKTTTIKTTAKKTTTTMETSRKTTMKTTLMTMKVVITPTSDNQKREIYHEEK